MSDSTAHVPLSSSLPVSQVPPQAGTSPPASLRLWPGVVAVVLQWLIMLVPGFVAPASMAQFFGWMLGPVIGMVLLFTWWLFASRVRWGDRFLVLGCLIVAAAASWLLGHTSYNAFGMLLYSLPTVTTLWILWLVATPFLSWPVRRGGLVVLLTCAWLAFTLVRIDGIDGSFSAEFRPRWLPTAEERFLAEQANIKRESKPIEKTAAPAGLVLQPGDWPAFRGAERAGRRPGTRIATDWSANPPKQVWRHRVGPGWSSFAVVGGRLYTQEQRAEKEAVICYDANNGTELWIHEDATRFTEVVAGPGPRATPTFHEGRIYAQGANGTLNCLDALDGKVIWSHDIAADSGAKVPQWGFSASPLVLQGVVLVFAGGPGGKSVLGYNAQSGDLAWSAGEGTLSYCSLQPAKLDGVEQAVIATDRGLTAFEPTRGAILWKHDWILDGDTARVVQPAQVGEADFLLGTGFSYGTKRIHVRHEKDAWATDELWTTRAIRPYFNDLVIHKGHLYGFDNNFLTCVSLDEGKSKWKERGYGNGQVLLLPDQDLLLVLSEKGEVALVDAAPEARKERGRFPAIEGKTWNHPVVAHGKLFVRNGEEAACFELAEDGRRVDVGK